jgi:surface antigen
MELNKEYKSNTGAIRQPLYFSQCNRFVFVKCTYSNEKIISKWFWSNHRIFIDQKNINK